MKRQFVIFRIPKRTGHGMPWGRAKAPRWIRRLREQGESLVVAVEAVAEIGYAGWPYDGLWGIAVPDCLGFGAEVISGPECESPTEQVAGLWILDGLVCI